jgi:hypothetical protein
MSAHGYRYYLQAGVVYVRAWVSLLPTGGRRLVRAWVSLLPAGGHRLVRAWVSLLATGGHRLVRAWVSLLPIGGRRLCPRMGIDITHNCRSGLAREPATRNKKTVRDMSRTVTALAQ